jgi:WASH complex subunit 7
VLRVLINLDSIIDQQHHLKDDWNGYKRMIKNVHHNPTKLQIDMKKFYRYEKHLIELEGTLLDGSIFQSCVEQIFDDKESMVSKNSVLSAEFAINLKIIFETIDPFLNEHSSIDTRYKFVGLCGICVLYNQIYRNFDKKFFKLIWDAFKRIPIVVFNGTINWHSNEFLLQKLPNMARGADKNPDQSIINVKQSFLASKIQLLPKAFQHSAQIVELWQIKMYSLHDLDPQTSLSTKEQLFYQGVDNANYIFNMVTTIINLSISLNKPMNRSCILELCQFIELLKSIQITYHQIKEAIILTKQYILQSANRKLLTCIQNARRRIISDKKYSDKKLDILSGLVLAGNALNGPTTRERLLIAKLGLVISNRMKTFRIEENVDELLSKLEYFSVLETKVKQTCDTSFLYWHFNVLLPIYLSDLYENSNSPDRIHYMMLAVRDSMQRMHFSRHNDDSVISEKFLRDILQILKKSLLDRLCRDIETDLRLSIHLELKSDESKMFKDGLKDLSKFIILRPITIGDKYIDIRAYVSKYLDKTFYNLTTVALHDWKAYSEMRNLAEQKYKLKLIDPYLPSSTLEQGLDVLEIMRNIHVFVTRYLYNMNNQIFIERHTNNKNLNTINIRHIANSIRTHGIGIMNTTVNFTYQYLRKQFYIFSQFLFDEHIKAKLIKDITFYKENKTSLEQKVIF